LRHRKRRTFTVDSARADSGRFESHMSRLAVLAPATTPSFPRIAGENREGAITIEVAVT
jgi:hypothetical protein